MVYAGVELQVLELSGGQWRQMVGGQSMWSMLELNGWGAEAKWWPKEFDLQEYDFLTWLFTLRTLCLLSLYL